jgi:hypothetical protein
LALAFALTFPTEHQVLLQLDGDWAEVQKKDDAKSSGWVRANHCVLRKMLQDTVARLHFSPTSSPFLPTWMCQRLDFSLSAPFWLLAWNGEVHIRSASRLIVLEWVATYRA